MSPYPTKISISFKILSFKFVRSRIVQHLVFCCFVLEQLGITQNLAAGEYISFVVGFCLKIMESTFNDILLSINQNLNFNTKFN